MSTLKEMSGTPMGTPGSAEGTLDPDQQSQTPPSGHTPGSAENGGLDDVTDASEAGDTPTGETK